MLSQLSQFPYSALNNPGFPVGTWFELQFVVARWYSKSGPNNAGTLPREQMPPHRPLGAGFSVQRLESFCLANTCKSRQTKDFLGMDADCPATHAPPWWLDVKAMPKMDTLKERQKWLKGTAFCKSNFWLLRPLCGLKLCQQIWCVGSRQGLEDYSYYSNKSASSCYSVLYEGFPNFFKHPWPVCGLVILFLHVSHGLGFLVRKLNNWNFHNVFLQQLHLWTRVLVTTLCTCLLLYVTGLHWNTSGIHNVQIQSQVQFR